MMAFICETCREGFDIEISGGIDCPECGSRRWASICNLPPKAQKYRDQWAEAYGVYPLNEGEEIPERFLNACSV